MIHAKVLRIIRRDGQDNVNHSMQIRSINQHT